MRETIKHPNKTSNLHVQIEISPNTSNDPMVDTHLLVVKFSYKKQNTKLCKRRLFIKTSSPDSKADLSQK